VWPLVSVGTFERVTGPKVDEWLVYMVGLLALSIGVVLWVGARASRPAGSIVLLAVLTAISFAAIDVRFALAGRISRIYLLDAAAEAVLLLAIAVSWGRARHTLADEHDRS
jgi:hypothetical protein